MGTIQEKYAVLIRYMLKYKQWAFCGGGFMILGVLSLLPTPMLTAYLIDDILPSHNVKELLVVIFVCVFVLILKAISDNLQNYYFNRFNQMVIFNLQLDLLRIIQQTSNHYRHQKETGYLMARLRDDPYRLQNLFANTYIVIIKDVLTLLVGIVILLHLHWKLALVTLLVIPFFILALRRYKKIIRQLTAQNIEADAQYQKKLQESISLIDTLWSINAIKYDTIRLLQSQKRSIHINIKNGVVQTLGGSIISFIGSIAPLLVLGCGFYEVINGHLKLGELIAFNSFIGYVLGPTNRLMNMSLSMQQSLISWERIYEILLLAPKQNVKLQRITPNGKEMTLENVCLKYGEKRILDQINISFRKGETTAIIGESGVGKSSLISLITRQNRCTSGRILLDGVDISSIDQYNSFVSLVEQEPELFTGSIYENLTLGRQTITKEKAVEAAKMAQIHDFIMSLPAQYATVLNERGKNLSIGQKQRLALARSILCNPIIFLLDEPTSNLDVENEHMVLTSMATFMKERISIIVSHHLTNLVFADRVIMMQEGGISEYKQ